MPPESESKPRDSVYDSVKFLAGTRDRFRILRILEGSSHTQSELEEKVDVHRTTLRRNLRRLQDHNWIVEERGKIYTIAPAGEIILSSFSDLLKEIESATKVGLFLSKLPGDFPGDVDSLSSAKIVLNGFNEPFAAINEFTTFIKNAKRLRLCLPVINPRYTELLADQSTTTDIEIIGPKECFEPLMEANTTDFGMLQRSEAVQMIVIDERPPFGICLDENRYMIVAYNDGNGIDGVLRISDPKSRIEQWIIEEYNSFKRSENRVELPIT